MSTWSTVDPIRASTTSLRCRSTTCLASRGGDGIGRQTSRRHAPSTCDLANWAQIQARISNKYKVDRVVGYAETPGPNPPVGEADLNVLGSATSNPLPPQVSLTVTERTNLRRNWGRIYIPGIASVHLTDVGRFSDANCIVFADW